MHPLAQLHVGLTAQLFPSLTLQLGFQYRFYVIRKKSFAPRTGIPKYSISDYFIFNTAVFCISDSRILYIIAATRCRCG
jgi:hypothetical protein